VTLKGIFEPYASSVNVIVDNDGENPVPLKFKPQAEPDLILDCRLSNLKRHQESFRVLALDGKSLKFPGAGINYRLCCSKDIYIQER
jgi:hypothetical protein